MATEYLHRQMVDEATYREIVDNGFRRDYAKDGSFRLRRVSDNALLDDLDQFGNLKQRSAVA